MLLAIDIGNTNVVMALFDGRTRRGQWRIATSGARTADQYVVWLDALLERVGLSTDTITHAIIASVVPDATVHIVDLCEVHLRVPVHVVTTASPLGVIVDIDRPGEAGADRLVNVIAACAWRPPPLVVVDLGTATTLDVVDQRGAYIGGAIAPGVRLSMAALHNATAKLPKIDVQAPPSVIGRNTIDAMQSGLFLGYVALIEGLLARTAAALGLERVPAIATGGLARAVCAATDSIDDYDPELTLTGLVIIHERLAAQAG